MFDICRRRRLPHAWCGPGPGGARGRLENGRRGKDERERRRDLDIAVVDDDDAERRRSLSEGPKSVEQCCSEIPSFLLGNKYIVNYIEVM